jgi:hypothetical protein
MRGTALCPANPATVPGFRRSRPNLSSGSKLPRRGHTACGQRITTERSQCDTSRSLLSGPLDRAAERRKWRIGLVAEGVGFEPTIRFPVYTLSKRAPSATRPPLRTGERAQYSGRVPSYNRRLKRPQTGRVRDIRTAHAAELSSRFAVILRVKRHRRNVMGRGLLLWLLGIPLPIILLIWVFGGLHG